MTNAPLFKLINNYVDLNEQKAIEDLQFFIQCKTVSNIDQTKMDFSEFQKIHEYMIHHYPFINKFGTPTIINQGSIYYKIDGASKTLPALVLMGHLDVVPIIQEKEWTFDPFGGQIINNCITGRGALDMKHIDCAILNAVEYSLSHYGIPDRTIYICFGHDEETLGGMGQLQIKNDLKNKKANIGLVLDEGGSINDGSKYHAKATLLEIQVMEKGYLDIVLEGFSQGGHSSHPGFTTALTDVANAITKITSNPFKPKLNKPMISFFKQIKDYIIDDELKKLVENIENDSDSVATYLSKDPVLDPIVRTTIAPTMIESDSKGANVLPQHVKALLNLRLSNFDTIENAYTYIQGLCKEYNVKVSYLNAINASSISSIESNEYQLLTKTINNYFNIDKVVPSVSVGGTDCCFYNEICDNCYRFCPIIYNEEFYSGIHGINERVNINSYIYGIKFYIDLIKKYTY